MLTPKAKQLIKCIGKDPKVVEYINSEIQYDDKVYPVNFLANFLACLKYHDKPKELQDLKRKEYQKLSRKKLISKLVKRLKPGSVATYMFLIYTFEFASSRIKERYLKELTNKLKYTPNIQRCLCLNVNAETLISGELIADTDIKELYLLPSGRCVEVNDLIQQLLHGNKLLDPTDDPKKPPSERDPLWQNGYQLREMLDYIQNYDYSQGKKIKQQFQQVLHDSAEVVTPKTRELFSDIYPLFYFVEADNKEQIRELLIKYKYPSGETADIAKIDKLLANSEYPYNQTEELADFRVLIGFKLGSYIFDEMTPAERDAFVFIGEFTGLGKEAWAKLTLGEFCTKTFGTQLHRIADLLAGKWSLVDL